MSSLFPEFRCFARPPPARHLHWFESPHHPNYCTTCDLHLYRSTLREERFKASLAMSQLTTDIAVNLLFALVVCVATIRLHLQVRTQSGKFLN